MTTSKTSPVTVTEAATIYTCMCLFSINELRPAVSMRLVPEYVIITY